jgi:hypothetical protein
MMAKTRPIGAMVLAALVATPAVAQSRWLELGVRDLDDRSERAAFAVRVGDYYRRIRLCVDRAQVDFSGVTVRFRSGGTRTLDLRSLVERGDCTAPIDLNGERRELETVVVHYLPRSLGGSRARVRLLAG